MKILRRHIFQKRLVAIVLPLRNIYQQIKCPQLICAVNWSKGKTKPTIENIIKIAKTLNCSIDFILGRTII